MADPRGESTPLTGGRMACEVVRIGEHVLRPATASSGFVADLLRLFENRGFNGAPRYLGQSDGKDILSFIPGEVPERFQLWSDEQVTTAGALLRSMHDATRGSELAGRWPVVCHHDPGPNNAVFQNNIPVAFIDFDTAAPGSPLEDIGYAAWTWCIASKQVAPVGRQAQQVRLLVDGYDLHGPERAAVVDAILERQSRTARFWTEIMASPETAPAEPEVLASRIEWSHQEHQFTFTHRRVFEEALAARGTRQHSVQPETTPPLTPSIAIRACAVITAGDRICLIRRQRPDGEQYSLPGGLIETDETVDAGLARELREELGLHIGPTTGPAALRWTQDQLTTRADGPFRRLHLIHHLHLPPDLRTGIATVERDAHDVTEIVWPRLRDAAGLHLYPAAGAALVQLAREPDTARPVIALPPITDASFQWR